MTDKEKIRTEVERLMNELIQEKEKGFGSDIDDACILELQNVLTFIDSMQEETVSEDFEKIVEEIAEPTILNAYGTKELARRLRNTICYISVSEELEEAAIQFATDTETGKVDVVKQSSFFWGAIYHKQQMMAKAVDGDITFDYYGDNDKIYGCIAHDSFSLEEPGLKDGDKVKLIIIKEG